mmetsp:Transcript_45481/g.78608  ORF Transcript_45481/g.78608 Transcript_45481/m.78608 type:complete len:277 (-) Transcript_45481:36-866(-)
MLVLPSGPPLPMASSLGSRTPEDSLRSVTSRLASLYFLSAMRRWKRRSSRSFLLRGGLLLNLLSHLFTAATSSSYSPLSHISNLDRMRFLTSLLRFTFLSLWRIKGVKHISFSLLILPWASCSTNSACILTSLWPTEPCEGLYCSDLSEAINSCRGIHSSSIGSSSFTISAPKAFCIFSFTKASESKVESDSWLPSPECSASSIILSIGRESPHTSKCKFSHFSAPKGKQETQELPVEAQGQAFGRHFDLLLHGQQASTPSKAILTNYRRMSFYLQ